MKSVSDEVEIGKSRKTANQENMKSGDSETSKPEESEKTDIKTPGPDEIKKSRNRNSGHKHEEET